MSLETDTMEGVRRLISEIKSGYERNLKTAVSKNMITVDPEKIPGLTRLMSDTVDQALTNGSDYLLNVLKYHSKK